MKKLLLSLFFLILIFSNSNAIEIDLNDPYYKIGWKNLENPENTSIIIPDANASIEIIETEIYLDSKENIKKRGRDYEQNIDSKYLKSINAGYLDFHKTQTDLNIKIIDINNMDFVNNRIDYLSILKSICQ